jgi:hypothetical protein
VAARKESKEVEMALGISMELNLKTIHLSFHTKVMASNSQSLKAKEEVETL